MSPVTLTPRAYYEDIKGPMGSENELQWVIVSGLMIWTYDSLMTSPGHLEDLFSIQKVKIIPESEMSFFV